MKMVAAERMYLQTQILMLQWGMQVKGLIVRIFEMNNYLEYMPCLKDVEVSPTELVRASKPFFPMDVDQITKELVLIEPAFGQTRHLMEQTKSHNGGKVG